MAKKANTSSSATHDPQVNQELARYRLQRDLVRALAGSTTIEDALPVCLQRTLEAAGLDCGGIYLQEQATGDFVLTTWHGLSAPFVENGARITVGSPRWQIVMAGKPIYAFYDLIRTQNVPAVVNEGLRAFCMVPVLYEDRPVATLNLASHSLDDITPASRETIEEIAQLISGALQRILLQAELQRSEARYATLFNQMHDAVLISDLNGNYVSANQRAAELLGYTREEITQRSIHDLSADVEKNRLAVEQLSHDGYVPQFESLYRRKDGSTVPTEVYLELVRDTNGAPINVQSVVRDITQRKQIEDQLRKKEAHYRLLVETLDISLCRWLPDTSLTFANEKYRQIFCVEGDAVGLKWLDFLPEDARPATAAFYAEVTANPRTVTYEHPVTVQDGSTRHYHWTDTPILDEHGQVVEFQSVGMDITQRKQAEEALAESEARLKELMASMPDAVVIVDAHGQIQMTNVQTETLFGYSQSELVGASVENLIPERLKSHHELNRAHFMVRREYITAGVDHTIYARRKNGEEFPVEISLGHHELSSGEVVILASIRDVTERIRTEQLIATQRDLARLGSANLPKEQLWSACLQAARDVSGLDCGGIYLFNQYSRTFELVYHTGLSQAFTQQVGQIAENSPSGQIMQSGLNYYFAEADLNAQPPSAEEGLRCMAALAVQYQGEVLGCMNVASHSLSSVPEYALSALEAIAAEIGNILIHQRTKESLVNSRKQLSQAMRVARMGAWSWMSGADSLNLSPESAHMLGEQIETIGFEQLNQKIHPDDLERVHATVRAAFQFIKPFFIEYRIFDKHGNQMWVNNYGHVECDADGKAVAITGLLHDITQRKQAEAALQAAHDLLEQRVQERTAELERSEQRNRAIVNTVPDLLFEIDADGVFLDYAVSDLSMLFAAPEDFLGHKLDIVLPAHIASLALAATQEALTQHKLVMFEYGVEMPGGQMFYDCRVVPLSERSVLAVIRDITERKRAEIELFESREAYRSLVESLDSIVTRVDRNGRYLYVSPLGARLMGKTPEEIVGTTLFETFPSGGAKASLERIQQVIDSGVGMVGEMDGTLPDGQTRWARVSIQPVFDASKKAVHAVVTNTDITELKATQQRLEATNQALGKALRARDEFLATISHELRTPLTGILGISEAMQYGLGGALNEKQLRYIQNIDQSGRRLLTLVNDVLDYTQIQAGKLQLARSSCSLASICHASLGVASNKAAARQQQLDFSITPESIQIAADEQRLAQILANLLDNAIKFTPVGGSISLSVIGLPDENLVHIVVTDTGIGIKAEDLPRLFQPFVQFDARLSREYEGTGLGLAMVRALVELHQGSVAVESTPGQGSRFIVSLPWQ